MAPKENTAPQDITWEALDTEQADQSYRGTFVRLFKKYSDKRYTVEGQPLTQGRFAEHFGIKPTTLRNWLRDAGVTRPSKAQREAAEQRKADKAAAKAAKAEADAAAKAAAEAEDKSSKMDDKGAPRSPEEYMRLFVSYLKTLDRDQVVLGEALRGLATEAYSTLGALLETQALAKVS